MINNTNEKIRYVAFKFFLEKGYEATNIRDICKEVDIKASSLYFYYKSKKELFFSIYDEICSENLKHHQDIVELNQNIDPYLKLYNLYKSMIKHYELEIVKQKFLLRYHLFPPEEISILIREKHKLWTNQENKIVMDIVNECLDRKILKDIRLPIDYMQEYVKIENFRVIEMIIFNIKMSDSELEMSWLRFWNGQMLAS